MSEVSNLSDPHYIVTNEEASRHAPRLVSAWWSLYLGAVVVGRGADTLFKGKEISQLVLATWISVAGDVLWTLAGIAAILMVKSITEMQATRHNVRPMAA